LSDPVAQATLDVAYITGVLAAGTLLLAGATFYQARKTSQSVQLQERELKAVEEQLKLAREQFEATRLASVPLLEVDAGFPNSKVMRGIVHYITGTDPAFEVEVWARGPAGYYGGRCGILTPSRPDFAFHEGFQHLAKEAMTRWPFAEVLKLPALAENEAWVGVTWQTYDRGQGQSLFHQHSDGRREHFNPVFLASSEDPNENPLLRPFR
jgi:hypothetical protein